MDLKDKVLASLDDGTWFNHSSIELAKERLENRYLDPFALAIFFDAYSRSSDAAILEYLKTYLEYFEGYEVVLYVPEFNTTAQRIAIELQRLGPIVARLGIGEPDWKKTEEVLQAELIDKILSVADGVLFITEGNAALYREVCESGYLVSRKLFHEARSKKGRRG